MRKRILGVFLALTMTFGVISGSVFAAEDTPFMEHEHWLEVSADTVNGLYNSGGSFVAMYYMSHDYNSIKKKDMLESWMNNYGLDIYGVDAASHGVSSWAFEAINAATVTIPVICVVENGAADVFTGEDSVRDMNIRVQAYAGVSGGEEFDFSRINSEVFAQYSTSEETARALYLKPENEIWEPIANEAKGIVSGLSSDREKLKAIYDWVVSNIYYNYGMLDGTAPTNVSPEYTYENRDSVCEGYARLTTDMCNAVGIPCRMAEGFASGIGTEDVLDTVWGIYRQYLANGDIEAFKASIDRYANHAWNEAYVDGEWIILDTTWGSKNKYYPASSQKISGEPTDKYFDPDFYWFSESHLFWTDYSAEVVVLIIGDVNDDGMVNAKDRTILSRYITGWDGYDAMILNWDAADINRDGRIDAKDKTILNRYIAGWDGYERYFTNN